MNYARPKEVLEWAFKSGGSKKATLSSIFPSEKKAGCTNLTHLQGASSETQAPPGGNYASQSQP